MWSCLQPPLRVLCLVVAAAVAGGTATTLWAQERRDTVRWPLDDPFYLLQDVTRHDLWGLGRDRGNESLRRFQRSLVPMPRVQGLDHTAVIPARGLVERHLNAGCPQLLRDCNHSTGRRAAPWLPPSFEHWTVVLKQARNAGQQRVPLPAYDDIGNPITRAEVESRMRGGWEGRATGGLIGALVGGGLGLALGLGVICPIEYLGPGCSPRDEAYRTVAILSGFAWGIAIGALAGGEISQIDRWEALEQIRAERRRVRTRGGE